MPIVIAVSGYNASGKSTVVDDLAARLAARGVCCRVVRFDRLYPSTFLTRKTPKGKKGRPGESGKLGLRELEGQAGSWDKRFGWKNLMNTLAASLGWHLVRLWNPRSIVLFDRYFYDRQIHFAPRGLPYRLAQRFAARPSIAIVLLPAVKEWERRILQRLRRRTGLELAELSQDVIREFAMVMARYEEFCRQDRCAAPIDSSSGDALEAAWECVARLLPIDQKATGPETRTGGRVQRAGGLDPPAERR